MIIIPTTNTLFESGDSYTYVSVMELAWKELKEKLNTPSIYFNRFKKEDYIIRSLNNFKDNLKLYKNDYYILSKVTSYSIDILTVLEISITFEKEYEKCLIDEKYFGFNITNGCCYYDKNIGTTLVINTGKNILYLFKPVLNKYKNFDQVYKSMTSIGSLHNNFSLNIPNIKYERLHNIPYLIDNIYNSKWSIEKALMGIRYNLDYKGSDLKAMAYIEASGCCSGMKIKKDEFLEVNFLAPFYVFQRKRSGTSQPYFACYINDNEDLNKIEDAGMVNKMIEEIKKERFI